MHRQARLAERDRLRAILWIVIGAISLGSLAASADAQHSVARQWNEALLSAIRIDFPAPTVHSRNLYHTSAAMWDAWATYDDRAMGHFYVDKHMASNPQQAREVAISYAAYRVLSHRYSAGLAVNPVDSQALFDGVMDNLGLDKSFTSTVGDTPAAVGNRIGQQIIDATLHDGSNEANGYADNTNYRAVNEPMVVDFPALLPSPGTGQFDPNQWQPLFIDSLVAQNEIPLGTELQEYVGPHWGNVTTFALGRDAMPGAASWRAIDPGAPPQINGIGDAAYRDNTVRLIEFSHSLDPNKGPGAERINISPRVSGNRPLGTHDDRGYGLNPVTGQPYEDNMVKVADYGRVLAEFWADGPQSETPPGHWNVIANEVADQLVDKRIGGVGPIVDDLEYDVTTYFALNGAVHDAAVAAWGTKRQYNYSRPITMIRYQAGKGQSSDSSLPSYDPEGLPLVPGMIELITEDTIAPGGRHRNAFINANLDGDGNTVNFIQEDSIPGKIAILAWNHEPLDPDSQVSGTDWILAENWVPYQQDNFVTPAFAAYVSGHSTFSRAAAEVLARITGSEYFPGGLGQITLAPDYLDFEMGPSEEITLQWASYFDAADEAGISRLWGGIHVPPDDFAGRVMGSAIGIGAYEYARQFFAPVPEPGAASMLIVAAIGVALTGRRRGRGR